jgi:hypothetical protein
MASSLSSFTSGDLVISIVGNGANTGTYTDNQATPITLEELTTSGTVVGQLVLPQQTTVVNGTTEYAVSGEYGSSSEGTLELASNGQSLVIAGYGVNAATYNAGGAAVYGNAALAQSTSLTNQTAYTPVARVVADISYNGTVDTSTALYNVYNTNNPRSVTTVNGTTFYLSGQGVKGDTTQGVFVANDGASNATAIDTSTDTRSAEIVNGKLYVSRDSTQGTGGTSDIATYGSTLPTSATTPTVLPGIAGSVTLTAAQENTVNSSAVGTTVNLSPENFFFANATTLYVADGGNPKEGGLGDGGLQKWSLVNGTWVLDYTLSTGLNLVPDTSSSGTSGLIGLTGVVSGGNVILYATNETIGDLDQTYLYTITDTLGATTLPSSESFTVLATAAPDTNIRGISFAPSVPASGGSAVVVSSGVTSSGLSVSSGGSVTVLAGGTLTSATLLSGVTAVISGGRDQGDFIAHGGAEIVRSGSASGGVVDGTQTVNGTVASVSSEVVENGGVISLASQLAVASVTSGPVSNLPSTLPISTTSVGSSSTTPLSFTSGAEKVTFTANNGDALQIEQVGNNYNDNNFANGTYLVAQGGYSFTNASTDSTTVSFSAPVSAFSISADDFDTTQAYTFTYVVHTTDSGNYTFTTSSLADNGQTPAILSALSTTDDITSVTISDTAANSPDGDFVLGNVSFAGPVVTQTLRNTSALTAVPVTTTSAGTASSTPLTFVAGADPVTITANNGDQLQIEQVGNNYNDNNFSNGTYLVAQGGYTFTNAATDSTTVSFAAPVSGFSISADDFDTTQAYTFTYVVTTTDDGTYTYTASSLADNGQSPALLTASSTEADIKSVTITDTASSSPDGDFVLGNIQILAPAVTVLQAAPSSVTTVPINGSAGTTSTTPLTYVTTGQAVTFTSNNGDALQVEQVGNNYNDNNFTSGTTLVAQGGYNFTNAATDSTTVSFAAPVAGFSISADDFDTTQTYTFTYTVTTTDDGSFTYTASSLADNGQSPAILAATSTEADIVSVTISDTASSSPDGDFVLGNVGYVAAPVTSAITVASGGVVSVSSAELVSNAVINGGTLVLSAATAAVTGSLTFSGGGTLQEAVLASSGFGDQAVISGFGSGSVVDVTALAYSGATLSTAVVSGNTVATITNGGASASFTFAGSVGSSLGLAADSLATPGAEIVFVPPAPTLTVVSSGVTSTGNTITSGSTLIVSSGGTLISATIQSGVAPGSAVINGVDSGTVISSGGNETVLGTATGDKVYGVQLVSAATALVTSETVFNGGAIDMFLKGASAVGTVVSSGGLLAISGNASATNTTLAGGATIQLQSPKATLSGGIIETGTSNTISLTGAISAGYGDLGVISGFVAGDIIDLTTFGSGATVSSTVSSGNTLLTVSSGTGSQSSDTFVFAGAYTSSFFNLVPDGSTGVEITAVGTPCYCPGTLIATPAGEVPVEQLVIGDRITTASGRQRPIKWIGRRAYGGRFASGKKHILPVRFTQGSLGNGLPKRDLMVSPLHAMFLDEVLIPASALVNGVSIVQLDRVDSVEYIHIELETHDVILAEGAPSETFVDDQSRGMFHNASEYARLYPNAAIEPARYCAPRLEDGEEVEAVRRRLAAIAAPAASFGAGIEGCLDEASRGWVRGWAVDRDMPSQPVQLQIVVDGVVLCEVVADMFRADLLAAGIGDGRHAFDVTIPGGLPLDQTHVISVRRKDDGVALGQRLCA